MDRKIHPELYRLPQALPEFFLVRFIGWKDILFRNRASWYSSEVCYECLEQTTLSFGGIVGVRGVQVEGSGFRKGARPASC
jgi:hypothetical protein